jgi:DNA helicase HerA-like ATPase
MLLIGTQTVDSGKPIKIPFKGLLHHTLIVGQSGSGKSFFIARLAEEILLRTRARVLIVDPNGDFRQLSSPNDEFWSDENARLLRRFDAKGFDEKEEFKAGWAKRRFTYLLICP